MADPLIAGAIAAPVAAGILGYMNTQKAMKMNAAERQRMADLLNKVQQPNFDFSTFTPEEYKLVGKYVPEVQSLIAEAAPELVKDTAASKEGIDAQRAALQKFMQISQGGPDIEQRMAAEMAARNAAIQNQGSIAALNELQARQGAAPGSGLQYAQSLQALQGGNQNAALTGQQAALDAYRNRLDALKTSANIGSGLTGQERQMSAQNADIINQFNNRISALRGQNIDRANEAQRMNLGAAQTQADKNVLGRNQAFQYNQQNRNDLLQRQYDNALKPIGIMSGMSQANQTANLQGAQLQNQAMLGASEGVSAGALYGADSGSSGGGQRNGYNNTRASRG